MIATTFENLLLCLIALLCPVALFCFREALKTPELYPARAIIFTHVAVLTVYLVGIAALGALIW
jgi:hypothetical protein